MPSLLKSHCHRRALPCGSLTLPVICTGSVVQVDEGLDVRTLIEGAVFRSATTLIVADEGTECPWPSETVTLRVYCTFDVVYVWVPGLPVAVAPSPKSHAYVIGSKGLNDTPLILGEPVAGARIVTVVRWTVKKSPPSWLTRRATS